MYKLPIHFGSYLLDTDSDEKNVRLWSQWDHIGMVSIDENDNSISLSHAGKNLIV